MNAPQWKGIWCHVAFERLFSVAVFATHHSVAVFATHHVEVRFDNATHASGHLSSACLVLGGGSGSHVDQMKLSSAFNLLCRVLSIRRLASCTSEEDCIGSPDLVLIQHKTEDGTGDVYCAACWSSFLEPYMEGGVVGPSPPALPALPPAGATVATALGVPAAKKQKTATQSSPSSSRCF